MQPRCGDSLVEVGTRSQEEERQEHDGYHQGIQTVRQRAQKGCDFTRAMIERTRLLPAFVARRLDP